MRTRSAQRLRVMSSLADPGRADPVPRGLPPRPGAVDRQGLRHHRLRGRADRSLGQRRLKRPAAVDLAGMIRSFHYASQAAALRLEPRPQTRRSAPAISRRGSPSGTAGCPAPSSTPTSRWPDPAGSSPRTPSSWPGCSTSSSWRRPSTSWATRPTADPTGSTSRPGASSTSWSRPVSRAQADEVRALEALCAVAGVETEFTGSDGARHHARLPTLAAILGALGVPISRGGRRPRGLAGGDRQPGPTAHGASRSCSGRASGGRSASSLPDRWPGPTGGISSTWRTGRCGGGGCPRSAPQWWDATRWTDGSSTPTRSRWTAARSRATGRCCPRAITG